MTAQHRTLTLFGLAALAAGLLGTAKPAAAFGLTHPAAFTRTAIADHDGDWNRDSDYRRDERRREEFRQEKTRQEETRQAEFRRQQERREEERRREEWQHDHRQDFRDGDRHQDIGDWHNDNRDNR